MNVQASPIKDIFQTILIFLALAASLNGEGLKFFTKLLRARAEAQVEWAARAMAASTQIAW